VNALYFTKKQCAFYPLTQQAKISNLKTIIFTRKHKALHLYVYCRAVQDGFVALFERKDLSPCIIFGYLRNTVRKEFKFKSLSTDVTEESQ
jgi:hypothetical protein